MPKINGNGKYDTHVKPRLETIRGLKRHGVPDEEIAVILKVAPSTFALYKTKHPELSEALKEGKDDAVAKVEGALYRRAMGYDVVETKSIGTKKEGEDPVVTRYEKTVKQVHPDVTAQIFFLKNVCPERWRDKQDLEHSGNLTTQAVVHWYIPDNGLPHPGREKR